MTTGAHIKFTINLLLDKVIPISLKLYQLEVFILLYLQKEGTVSRETQHEQPKINHWGRSCSAVPSRQEPVLAGTGAQARGCFLWALLGQHRCCTCSQCLTGLPQGPEAACCEHRVRLPPRCISEITAPMACTQTLPQSAEPPVSDGRSSACSIQLL